MNKNRLITTATPLRISFFGGGTDFKKFYNLKKGQVISSTIDKYIYVTIKDHSQLYSEKYRLNYSITEKVNDNNKIRNDIIRAALKLLNINQPLLISTYSDLPANSGLGSSSSFCVGLLNALHHFLGENVSAAQLAEEACKVEIDILKNPIGKQDQYIAAFGGMNNLIFLKNDRVQIEPINVNINNINELFENAILVWTGVQRSASKILLSQNKNTNKNIENYKYLLKYCNSFKKLINNHNGKYLIENTAKLIELSWQTKRKLNKSISTRHLDNLHNTILSMGGMGGKICGAGGGGFFLEFISKDKKINLIKKFGSKKLIDFKYEPQGSRLLYKNK